MFAWYGTYMTTTEAPKLIAAKITLRGPRPFGGSFTSSVEDPTIDRLLVEGWTVSRTWQVFLNSESQRYSVDTGYAVRIHCDACEAAGKWAHADYKPSDPQ